LASGNTRRAISEVHVADELVASSASGARIALKASHKRKSGSA
jgi:hypothetical protein